MSRRSSLNSLDVSLSREVDSKYDDIKIVADNITDVTTVATTDISALTTQITNLTDFTAITVNTVANGNPAAWDANTKVLTIPEGDRGAAGASGTTGAKGDEGEKGVQGDKGDGIDHITATSTNEPHGDFNKAGYTDTYSIYADLEETVLLGFFTVTNGSAGLTEFTSAEKAKLADTEVTSQLNIRDAANRDRANHTGTQLASTVVEEVDRRFVTDNDLTKLANSPSDTSSELDAKLDKAGGTITGTLTINADIIQNGAAYETHAEKVYTTNDEIILRDGAIGALGAGEFAGLRAKKYDGVNDGVLVFGSDGLARVGDECSTQALATREDTPVDTGMFTWDATSSRMVSSRNINVDSITVSGAVDGRDISADGATLDNVGTEADFDAAISF